MTTLSGVGVSPGRVIGPVRTMPKAVGEPSSEPSADPGGEIERLRAAAQAVHDHLQQRARQAAEAGRADAEAVLDATAHMATDPELAKAAGKLIDSGASAEYAVWTAGGTIAAKLTALGGYMAERAGDVADVRARIVAELHGDPAPGVPDSDTPFILAAADLAPADTAALDPSRVIGIVTSGGGPQSHTAILARAHGIPAVVAVRGAGRLVDGDDVYLDGATGTVVTDPGPDERARAARARTTHIPEFDGAGRLADGRPVELLANIGSPDDAGPAAASGAQGIGLFRTEFCFLGRDTEPASSEQVDAYRRVFEAFGEKKTVVRTLDAGADKPLPFLTDPDEPNPALGVRGFRTAGTHADVLRRQLAAIASAGADCDADVRVMAPMVATPEEAREFAELCRRAGLTTSGVMIEVPAAALRSEPILRAVDFASLGTNDLVQYTMAADRELSALADLSDPWQPAVLQLVAATVRGAEAAGGKPVGVCGEAAADPALAVVLAGLGVSSLSMSPAAIPAVSAVLRSTDFAGARELAALAVDAESAAAGKRAVRAGLPVLADLGL